MEQKATTTQPSGYSRLRGAALQFAFLAALWLIFSGSLEPLMLTYGLISILVVIWLNWKMDMLPLAEDQPCGTTRVYYLRLVGYLFYLLWQVVKAGTYVAYVILHPKMPINPKLVSFESQQPNVVARVILGNSITLTPGTLTVQIEGNNFVVHALDEEVEASLLSGEMEANVARLYTDECREEDVCCNISFIDMEEQERKE